MLHLGTNGAIDRGHINGKLGGVQFLELCWNILAVSRL